MELLILENLVVFYWFLLDINAFNEFEYWKSAGLQVKYAFKKTIVKRMIITLLSSKISIMDTTKKLCHLTGIS